METQKAAHEAALKARKAAEEKQIAEHKKILADRNAKFQQAFKNVWATGPTGVSVVTYTVETSEGADALVSSLFQ